jgi:hypothetical protein
LPSYTPRHWVARVPRGCHSPYSLLWAPEGAQLTMTVGPRYIAWDQYSKKTLSRNRPQRKHGCSHCCVRYWAPEYQLWVLIGSACVVVGCGWFPHNYFEIISKMGLWYKLLKYKSYSNIYFKGTQLGATFNFNTNSLLKLQSVAMGWEPVPA